MIRLTYLPMSHLGYGLTMLGGLLLTGRAFKAEAEKQLILDRIEQQFWESLDARLAELTNSDATRGFG